MPVAKKPAAKPVAVKKDEVAAHKHDDLIKEIAELKKELAVVKSEAASLKGQCHSCCGDLADLKAKVENLKPDPSGSKDERVDILIQLLSNQGTLQFQKILKAKLG